MYYGSAVPQPEEDEAPALKPLRAEEQVVTDAQGRRRFHGAFTGGYSAGYYNSVGTKEGELQCEKEREGGGRKGEKE